MLWTGNLKRRSGRPSAMGNTRQNLRTTGM